MTNAPTSPEAALPQPPRDPFQDVPGGVSTPQEPSQAPQNEQEQYLDQGDMHEVLEAPENPKRIGVTYSRELDKRVRVMQERQASFQELLRQLGVVDPNTPAAGLGGVYVEALSVSQDIAKKLEKLKGLTNEVNQTLEAL